MKKVEISEQRLEDLHQIEMEHCINMRLFKNLNKDQKELLLKLEKYERALEVIAWTSDVNPLAGSLVVRAKEALYK